MRRWLTTGQAAEFLGVHPNTIRNWADSGRLEVVRTDGGQRRFDRGSLREHRLALSTDAGEAGERRALAGATASRGAARPSPAVTGQARLLAALAESVATASSRGGFPEVCSALARSAGEVLGEASVDVFLVHLDERELEYLGGWQKHALNPVEWRPGDRLPIDAFKDWRQVVDGADGVIVDCRSAVLSAEERAEFAAWDERWVMCVPLRFDERLIGIMDVATREADNPFSDEQLNFARVVAAHVAAALANARLVEHERQRAAQMEALLAIAAAVNSTVGLPRSLARIAREMGTALAADVASLYTYDASNDAMERVARWDRAAPRGSRRGVGRRRARADFHPSWRAALEAGRPVVADPAHGAAAAGESGLVVSWLTVPLYQDGALRGLVDVYSRDAQRVFDDDDVRFAGAVARHVEIALQGSEIVARSKRTAAVRETLVRYGAGLRLRDSGIGVAEELAAALHDLKLFEGAAVLLHDPRLHEYHVADAFGAAAACNGRTVPDDVVEAVVVAHAMGGGAKARAEQRRAEATLATTLELTHSGSRRRDLYAPIVDQQGESVGLVIARVGEAASAVVHGAPRPTAEAASLVRLLCDQAGIAIRAAHRLVELQRNLEQAWTLNEVVTAVGSTLDVSEVLRQAVGGMRRVTEFDTVAFWLASHDGTRAEVTTLGGPEGAVPSKTIGRRIDVVYDSADPVWRAIDLGRTVRVSRAGAVRGIPGLQFSGSAVVVPLPGEGRSAGAIVLGAEHAAGFSDAEVLFLEQFAAQIGAALQNARLYERIRNLHLSNLQALSTALNVKDTYMMTHAPRVAAYASLLCRRLGYDEERIEDVERAAYLHDIGRIGVPDSVLQKPDRLNEREWALVRDHATASADIIEPVFSEEVYLAIRHHHERWDGTGYPDGRRAEDLPELARVLALVDAYDAMTTGSSHARPRPFAEAVDELTKCAGKQFDPALVPVFVDLLGELDTLRLSACAAASAAAQALDWGLHATLRSAGGVSREHYPEIEAALGEVRGAGDGVARLFTIVPGERSYAGERGYVLAAGTTALGFSLPNPGEEVQVPRFAVDAAAGAGAHIDLRLDPAVQPTVLTIDAFGCWMSGYAAVSRGRGRPATFVQADVPVETGVRGAMSRVTDAGETLDSILRQAAARMTRIEAAANSDGLTGLYNHRYFQERLEQELARARNHDESLALLFCDLDHFKLYNDTVGHQAGDEALRSMAKVLHQELRRVDIAARYGGEEFAVILPDTGREGALEVAERIRRAVESGRETAPRGLPLTVSIGVAVCPADAADAAEIVDRADWAMYRAKRKGRNRVEGFAAGDDDS